MATTRCPRCKRTVAVTDGRCPNCRQTLGARKPIGLWIGIAAGIACVGLLVVIGAAGFAAYRLLFAPDAPAPVAEAPEKTASAPPKIVAPPRVEPPHVAPPAPQKQAEEEPARKKEPPLPPADPKALEELSARLLQQVNTYRKTAGLDLVRLDPELSSGCAAHARYLAINLPTAGARLVEEDPNRPGYSDEGRHAANVAMVSIGAARNAIEGWVGLLSARVQLLNPELGAIGVGVAPLPDNQWAIVLDVKRGIGSSARIVMYPAPDQTDVPLTFAGGSDLEDNDATAGYPITVTFPSLKKVTQVKAELRDETGKAVDSWLLNPEKTVQTKVPRKYVALIPKAPLRGAHTYRVTVAVDLQGKPWSRTWTFTTEDDIDSKGIWAQQALEKVNGIRKTAGLAPVTMDTELSRGCLAHARYLVRNLGHPKTEGLGAHDEDPSLPGATDEGTKAGRASDINIGDHEPLDGIDAWMATLYHRIPILEPNLKTVGFASARARWLGRVTVLNIGSGKAELPRSLAVYYPVPDQSGVPLHFPVGGEAPDPIPQDRTGRAGYPITAFFPDSAPVKSASATLTDDAGKDVPVWFSSAEAPANPKYAKLQGNTICLIPKEPLRPNTTYRVHLRGQRGGSGWQKAWQFTTGPAGPSPAEAAQQVVARLNVYRAAAGLPTVSLDTALCHGCQAHAEYLVRNAATLALKKLSVNDEDPALPGYSEEGNRAAHRTHVLGRAPKPDAQLDHVMGTALWRNYLLDPEMHRIGLGFANDVGRGWQCVLDPFGGRGGDRVVLYPVPDQESVPCAGFDRQAGQTTALGFPISVTFPVQAQVLGGKGTLTDAEGKTIETILATPERPLDPAVPLRNTICVYPRAPLRPGQSYHVTLSAVVNGQQWRQSWQFTTE
jgi:uncharacterized protein YkwD